MQMKRQVFGPVFFVFRRLIVEGTRFDRKVGLQRRPEKKLKKCQKGLNIVKKKFIMELSGGRRRV